MQHIVKKNLAALFILGSGALAKGSPFLDVLDIKKFEKP